MPKHEELTQTNTPTPTNEQLTKANHEQASALQATQNQSDAITDKKLEQWFASVERAHSKSTPNQDPAIDENDGFMANMALARFGIKNSSAVNTFLHSESGIELVDEIRENMAEEMAKEEYEQFLADEAAKRKQAQLSFLLLALMYQEAEAHDHLSEQINQQNEQLLHHNHTSTDTSSSGTNFLENKLDAFDKALNETRHVLEEQRKQADKLDKMLSSIQQEQQKEESNIDGKLNTLENSMEKKANEAEHLAQQGKHAESKQKLQEHEHMQQEAKGLKSSHGVLKGDKYLADTEGKPVNEYNQAALVLDKNQKVVKDQNGRNHIIGNKENLASMSQEKRDAAQKQYQSATNEHKTVRNHPEQSKQLQKAHDISHRFKQTQAQRERIHQNMSQLSTQNARLHAERGNTRNQLQRSKQTNQVEDTRMTPSISLKPPSDSLVTPQARTQRYTKTEQTQFKEDLKQWRTSRDPKIIDGLQERIKRDNPLNHSLGKNLCNDLETLKQLPRTVIPDEMMRSFERNLERFATEPYKANIAPKRAVEADDLKKENVIEDQNIEKTDAKDGAHINPTPLHTTPGKG